MGFTSLPQEGVFCPEFFFPSFSFYFSFAVPFVLLGGGGYLLEKKAGLGHWAFVCGIVLGALAGVYSMFRYILATLDWASATERRNRENDGEEKR